MSNQVWMEVITMSRRWISLALSMTMALGMFAAGTSASAVNTDTETANATDEQVASGTSSPVTLTFYSYLRDDEADGNVSYDFQQRQVITANRGDIINVKVKVKAENEPYLSSLSVRYDLKSTDNIDDLFSETGAMDQNNYTLIGSAIPKRESSLLTPYDDGTYSTGCVKFNDVMQAKVDEYSYKKLCYDFGAFTYSADDTLSDAFAFIPGSAYAYDTTEFSSMRSSMKLDTAKGGDEYCTLTFKVSEDTSLGDEQTVVIYNPEFTGDISSDTPKIDVSGMRMEISGSTSTETAAHKVTVRFDNTEEALNYTKQHNKIIMLKPRVIEGRVFSHWATDPEGENVVCTTDVYKFLVTQDTNLYAIYADSESDAAADVPTIAITGHYGKVVNGVNKIYFESTRNIPDGYTLKGHGILYSNKLSVIGDDLETGLRLNNTNIKKYKNRSTTLNSTDVLLFSVGAGVSGSIYARGYMQLVNDSTGKTVNYYSDIVSGNFRWLCQ
ncbi:MAG: hypothetical protein UIM53_05200 [Acutalibacteraceae bacterium]|nr:hypothetical protein [Acutalibacteraceae bacterium]